MKNRNFGDVFKNVVGTMFLLAGAGFVCSTLLSMRAVFADPIAPTATATSTQTASGRGATARTASSRTTNASTVARTTAANTVSRSVSGRPTVASRVAATSATTASRGNASTTASRGVASRTTTSGRTAAGSGATSARSVVARTATNSNARVSLSGSAIRGSKANTTSTAYTYLTNKLYTGNYSNIIDPTTGLISADAYNNCMESYYTCMDEICTARNAAQRRCACAGRVKAFAEAETALESANEELIKVSGELALLIATKGKDVSDAFRLTDAEKVMNCVSWQEVTNKYGSGSTQAIEWCNNHGIYGENGNDLKTCSKPSYCSTSGNNFGFDVTNIDGDGSDILASLQSWANAKEQTLTIVANDNDNLFNSALNVAGIVNGLDDIAGSLAASDNLKDSLAETWGYELFEYAHNNVCNRVLDSCFNGIYEACGTPPSTGRKCSNGAAQCPYNYNSMVSVTNTGTYELNFVTGNSGYTSSNSATCFGYTSSSGDPYSNLRGPVADARRSILQKYALDANADCDAYGEQLRTTAQNIGYQKVAAQQALQKKRLEFAQEEVNEIATEYRSAISNFNECLAELYDCYTTQETANKSWSTSRIKTYCSQVSNAPHCYEQMICSSPNSSLQAVINKDDVKNIACSNTTEYKTNTCRNIITIAEILSGSYASGAAEGSSVQMREDCLQKNGIEGVRNWKTSSSEATGWAATAEQCEAAGYAFDSAAQVCIPKTTN
ncbi:MAG: hypothetical protein K2I81_04075 [Alphaproteobacteria bacterium]|nr:hypothetical protein [Alphaproteobacteria bacterium]